MSPQENVNVVQQAYSNFKAGNIGGILERIADDIEWEVPEVSGVPHSGRRHGRTHVDDFFNQLNATEEVIAFEPREFIAQGDKVVALGTYRWRVKGTRRQYETDWAHIFNVSNGRITRFQQFMDTASIAEAYRRTAAA